MGRVNEPHSWVVIEASRSKRKKGNSSSNSKSYEDRRLTGGFQIRSGAPTLCFVVESSIPKEQVGSCSVVKRMRISTVEMQNLIRMRTKSTSDQEGYIE